MPLMKSDTAQRANKIKRKGKQPTQAEKKCAATGDEHVAVACGQVGLIRYALPIFKVGRTGQTGVDAGTADNVRSITLLSGNFFLSLFRACVCRRRWRCFDRGLFLKEMKLLRLSVSAVATTDIDRPCFAKLPKHQKAAARAGVC